MIAGLDGVRQYIQDTLNVLDQAIIIAGEGLAGDMANRVHVQGHDSNDSPIGNGYSTKPYFALIRNFASVGRIPANLISSTGVSVQLPAGYSDFRAFSGRQTKKVDLKYSGHLQTSYRFVRNDLGAYRIGFLGEQTPDKQGASAAEKAAHLESLYQKEIFSPTKKETDNFFADVSFEWANRSK
jgi:hypothetical protein